MGDTIGAPTPAAAQLMDEQAMVDLVVWSALQHDALMNKRHLQPPDHGHPENHLVALRASGSALIVLRLFSAKHVRPACTAAAIDRSASPLVPTERPLLGGQTTLPIWTGPPARFGAI